MTNPVQLTLYRLDWEYSCWPLQNRNAYDQRFGQHIYNKYGIDTANSYHVEDRHRAYDMLREYLRENGCE